MLMRWIEVIRRQPVDRVKAQVHATAVRNAAFRAEMGDYDAFADVASRVKEPAFLVGTARDSTGAIVPVRLQRDALAAHMCIKGGTGVGKTTFAVTLLDWALRHGLRGAILDCKSGFFESGIRSAAALAHQMPPAQRMAFRQRLSVFNPFGEALPPFNICATLRGSSAEVQAYDMTLALSRLFDGALSVHMENILRHLLLLLISSNLTLVEASLVLQDELVRGMLVERSGNSVLKDFFYRTYPSLPQTSTDALLSRLSALLLPENVRLMLGADELIDLSGIICRGDPLFVFLGKGPGIPEEQVNVIASMFLQLVFVAAFASGGAHPPYVLTMDEFFHIISAPALAERFASALTSLRSFNVFVTLILHSFVQVSPTLRETILGNCDLVALFRTSARDGEFIESFLPDRDPDLLAAALRRGEQPRPREMRRHLLERLQRLPNRECFFYDRRQPYPAVHVRVSDVAEPHERVGLSAGALDAFIKEQGLDVGGVALTRAVLRAQITARQERLQQLLRPPVRVSAVAEDGIPTAPEAPPSARRRQRPQLG